MEAPKCGLGIRSRRVECNPGVCVGECGPRRSHFTPLQSGAPCPNDGTGGFHPPHSGNPVQDFDAQTRPDLNNADPIRDSPLAQC